MLPLPSSGPPQAAVENKLMWTWLWRCRRATSRVVFCLAAVCSLFLASTAQARTIVPMCGDRAESVEAPPSMRSPRVTVLRADCNDDTFVNVSSPKPPRDSDRANTEAPPRMRPVMYGLPTPPLPTPLPRALPSGQALPAHARGIERPPR